MSFGINFKLIFCASELYKGYASQGPLPPAARNSLSKGNPHSFSNEATQRHNMDMSGLCIYTQCVCIVWYSSTLHAIWANESCEPQNIHHMEGFFCPQNEESLVLKRTTREQCMLLALHRQHQVISYNSLEHTCVAQSKMCPVLQPNEAFSIQFRKRNHTQCVHWIPYSG